MIWSKPFAFDAKAHLRPGKKNTLAVRVYNRRQMGGIYLPVFLVASDGEGIADGQGEDAGGPEEVDLPAFLTADLPDGNLGGRTACLSATCSSPSVPSGGSSSARDMQAGS